MVRDYELGLVINPDLSEEQIEAVIVRIGQTVEAREGTVVRLDRWGRRRLAYPIERHRDGYYAYLDLRMDTSAVREVERVVLVQEDIMRHLIMVIDPRMQEERKRRQEQEAARQAAMAQRQADMAAQAAANAQMHADRQAANAAAAEAHQAAPVATLATPAAPAEEAPLSPPVVPLAEAEPTPAPTDKQEDIATAKPALPTE